MFYQNSNRSDMSTEYDREQHLLTGRVNEKDFSIDFGSLDSIADLKDMLEEILILEKYQDE